MLVSRRSRLSALLAGAAIVAATLLPAFPAAAEEPPTPDPVVTAPAADPTPTSDPTPEATPSSEHTPTAEPTAEPTPASTPTEAPIATPTATPTPDAAGTVSYSGTAQQTSDDGIAIDENVVLFSVSGQGYLSIDVSALATKPDAVNPVLMTVKVPAGLTLSDDADVRFSQLATASAAQPLVAISAKKSKQTTTQATAQLVNQTPNTSATHHVFAVYVSPVNKKVKSPSQANNTAAQTLVTYADTYWSTQSSGSIHFTLDGVVPWYQSTYSCSTQAGSAALWSQALVKAKTAGFVPGKNNHLVLLFPDGAASNYGYCGGAIGLGSVGGSVNQGGQVWVMGDGGGNNPANLNMAKETIAHELGHNMSLGHADWLGCASSNPNVGVSNAIYGSEPGISGCDVYHYGDTTDVMGFGIGDGFSGALSSPQAIRAGIWPTSKWTTPGIGLNQTYTLLPVADHSGVAGWHSLVVQDTDGTAYFVELRNFQNEDATNFIGCDNPALPNAQVCTLGVPHVRILRFEPSGYSGYPGADTYLIGRSNVNVGYTSSALGTYTLPGGDSIQVTAVSATQATVKVNRIAAVDPTTSSEDWVNLARTVGYDGSLRVGDTMTLFLGDFWNQETYTFTWYRNGAVIPGANTQNYKLVAADLGTKINASVTPAGQSPVFDTDDSTPVPALPGGYGPIAAGIYQPSDPGTIGFNNVNTPFTAVVGSWPAGTAYFYQWYRGATASTATTAIAGATGSQYTPTAADYNQFLRVRLTADVPGYNPVVRYSAAANYSLQSPYLPTIVGTPKVGTQVIADTSALAFFDINGNSITGVSLAYQWLRNGVAIPGADATDADYTLQSADYATNITVRVTASKNGWVAKNITSAVFKPTQKGTIQGSLAIPTMVKTVNGATFKLTATLPAGSVTEAGVAYAYQWYRVNRVTSAATAITGATKVDYTPVAADYAYKLKVRVTVTKLNYTSVVLDALAKDYSFRVDPATPLGFNSAPAKVANTISYNPGIQFTAEQDNGSVSTVIPGDPGVVGTFQWYRTGIVSGKTVTTAIPAANGGTSVPYTIAAADVGKTLSYTIKVTYDGYLPYVATSPKTAAVGLASFTHNQDVAIQHLDPLKPLLMHALAAINDVIPSATAITYQWTRDGVAITGATKVDYTLTAADYGHTVKAKVTYSKPGYANYSQLDVNGTGKYWIRANSTLPEIVGDRRVGGVLEVDPRTYFDMINGGMTIPSADVVEDYQWYRTTIVSKKAVTVPIPGATGPQYTVQLGDKGATITVKMTVHGQPGLYTYDLPSVSTSLATPAIGLKSLPGAFPAAKPALVVQPSSSAFVTILGVAPTGITSPAGAAANTVAYQWLRDGAAIAGAIKSTYTLAQADRGHLIGVRITTSHAPVGTETYTTDVRYAVEQDFTLTSDPGVEVHVYTDMSVGSELSPTVPTYYDAATNIVPIANLQQKYQWYRTSVVSGKTVKAAIAGATHSNYYLQAADRGATISVTVTTSTNAPATVGMIPLIATYTTTPATLKVITGTLQNTATAPVVTMNNPATNELLATPPDVTGQALFPSNLTQHATFTYQWLRNGVAITGATANKYKLVAADWGKTVNVRATAVLLGYTSAVLPVSTPIDYSITQDTGVNHQARLSGGSWTVGTSIGLYDYTYYNTKDGNLVSTTNSIQWLRAGAVIAGATSDYYELVAADAGKLITARITVTKPGYVPLVLVVNNGPIIGKGVTIGLGSQPGDPDYPGPSVSVGPGAGVGTLLAQVDNLVPSVPVPAYTYKWYRSTTAVSAPALIAGATAATYKLTSLDYGKFVSVQVTMSRTNFTVPTYAFPRTTPVNYSITSTGATGLAPLAGLHTGDTLTATAPTFYETDGTTPLIVPPMISYTWYRSGVVIAGQTGDTYVLGAADVGKVIKVVATASAPGRVARSATASPSTAVVALGVIDAGTYAPATAINLSTRKATVTFTGSAVTPGPLTPSYQWYRNNVAIVGATLSTYTLLTTDTNKAITVVVKIAKAGYVTKTYAAAPGQLVNGFTQGEAAVIGHDGVPGAVSTATVGQTLNCIVPLYYLADGSGLQPFQAVPNGTQVIRWFSNGTEVPADANSFGFNYLLQPTDSGHTVTCAITIGAPLHKSQIETVTPGVVVSP